MGVGGANAWWLQFRGVGAGAAQLLEVLNCNAPPIDVRGICHHLGVAVVDLTDTTMSGQVMTRLSGEAAIGVRASDAETRKRFTIAHELGHVLLHPIGNHYRDPDLRPGDPVEAEANRFAADLLMPKPMLDTVVGRYSPRALASLFEVSEDAMAVRIRVLYGR